MWITLSSFCPLLFNKICQSMKIHLHDILLYMHTYWYTYTDPYINHYCDVIMSAMASQITSFTIVYSNVYSGADQRKHKSSASLAFAWGFHRWSVNSPHKGPVTRKMFPFDDVIMNSFISSEFSENSFQIGRNFIIATFCTSVFAMKDRVWNNLMLNMQQRDVRLSYRLEDNWINWRSLDVSHLSLNYLSLSPDVIDNE